MGKKGFIVCSIVICMAYGLTVFFYEREKNYPEIMAITGATPIALANKVPVWRALHYAAQKSYRAAVRKQIHLVDLE
jgi:hypothetical protein